MCDDTSAIPDKFRELHQIERHTSSLNAQLVTWRTRLERARKLEARAQRRAEDAARNEAAVMSMRARRTELRKRIEGERTYQSECRAKRAQSAQQLRQWRHTGPCAARQRLAMTRAARANQIRKYESDLAAARAALPVPSHDFSTLSARVGGGRKALEAKVHANNVAMRSARVAREEREKGIRERREAERAEKAARARAHRQRRLDKPDRVSQLKKAMLDTAQARRREHDLDQCGILYNKYVLPSEKALVEMQREHAATEQRRQQQERRAQTAQARLSSTMQTCPGGAGSLRATVVARGEMHTQPESPSRRR